MCRPVVQWCRDECHIVPSAQVRFEGEAWRHLDTEGGRLSLDEALVLRPCLRTQEDVEADRSSKVAGVCPTSSG